MVTRRKLRAFLSTLALYVGCALVIGYFGVNAYTGNHVGSPGTELEFAL